MIAQSIEKSVQLEKWVNKHLYCHSKQNLILIFPFHAVDVIKSNIDVNPLEIIVTLNCCWSNIAELDLTQRQKNSSAAAFMQANSNIIYPLLKNPTKYLNSDIN